MSSTQEKSFVSRLPTKTCQTRRERVINPVSSTFESWILEDPILSASESTEAWISAFTRRHTIYGPLLLLSPNILSHPLLSSLSTLTSIAQRNRLYSQLAETMKITHIAVNERIPSTAGNGTDNIIRAPINLIPLYGTFENSGEEPLASAFENTFWTWHVQHGITQVWAPSRTMFSRGNVVEKERLLRILDEEQHIIDPLKSSAVDLYAGIGYFTFCYAKAGFQSVLAWELNGWSVEGMKRGACRNGFQLKTFDANFAVSNFQGILAFNEDNALAPERVETLRRNIHPIRHVNCGLLPSSKGSWEIALQVLDPNRGGWIHIHDNVDVKPRLHSSSVKSEEIRCVEEAGEGILAAMKLMEKNLHGRELNLRRTFKVKNFAARVVHVVFDIYVDGRSQIVSNQYRDM